MRKKEKSNYDVGPTLVGQPTGALEHLCPIRVVSKWAKRTRPVCPHSDQSLAMRCFWECWGETPLGWGKPCRADCWANCWLTLQLGVLPWRDIWAEPVVSTTWHHLCRSNPFFMYAWGTSPSGLREASLPKEAFGEEALIGQIQALAAESWPEPSADTHHLPSPLSILGNLGNRLCWSWWLTQHSDSQLHPWGIHAPNHCVFSDKDFCPIH